MNNTEKVTKELQEFCENIEKWFRGSEQQEILCNKILSGFAPEFTMINGDGNSATLSMFSEWLPTVFGKFPNRSVKIENIEIKYSDHHALATYIEIQTTGDIANRRKSSAVFLIGGEKALWFHLVENWM